MYFSSKTYGHEIGLSCAFRQHKAPSHCRFLHGYSLSVYLRFKAEELDYRNWVMDFGGLKEVKKQLEDLFDHKTVISEDDPAFEWFLQGSKAGYLDLVVLENVGCEAFSKTVWDLVEDFLERNALSSRISLDYVEVREHGANSAGYSK